MTSRAALIARRAQARNPTLKIRLHAEAAAIVSLLAARQDTDRISMLEEWVMDRLHVEIASLIQAQPKANEAPLQLCLPEGTTEDVPTTP